MNFLENAAIDLAVKILTPIVLGMIVVPIVDALKRAVRWLDNAPAGVKQGAAVAVAALANGLTHLLGAPVPADLAQWDGDVIRTLCIALIAIAVKQGKQLRRR